VTYRFEDFASLLSAAAAGIASEITLIRCSGREEGRKTLQIRF